MVELAGWGNYPVSRCTLVEPSTTGEVATQLDQAGTIARGLGRSYGDAAINASRQVVGTRHLDRILSFDAANGVVTCEAGTSLERLIRVFGPKGWFPLVTPGTKLVTVGGCIANDVHGKAHHVQGSFAECVDSMRILLADGRVVEASRTEHEELFWATFGGMGLVGIVLDATLRLRRIETTYFTQRAIVARDLSAMIDALDETGETYPYSVAYIDPVATGRRLGCGVLTVGDHARLDDLPRRKRRRPLALHGDFKLDVPFSLPEISLNPITIRILNAAFKITLARAARVGHYESFFYPLDFVQNWNRGYGKRGFTQYQFVVPLEHGRENMRRILETIVSSGNLPFLNVLKRLGRASGGVLSFPREGYTLAIDFPIRKGLEALLHRLDAMVLEAGGRIYLGKDAFTTADMLHAMYPEIDRFRAIKDRYDPTGVFTSDLGRRVGLCR